MSRSVATPIIDPTPRLSLSGPFKGSENPHRLLRVSSGVNLHAQLSPAIYVLIPQHFHNAAHFNHLFTHYAYSVYNE